MHIESIAADRNDDICQTLEIRQFQFGPDRADPERNGHADLSIGVPTNMVAGAGFEPATFGL